MNFGDISAVELWLLFSSTVEGLFGPDENLDIFAPTEYVVLLFIVCDTQTINGVIILL